MTSVCLGPTIRTVTNAATGLRKKTAASGQHLQATFSLQKPLRTTPYNSWSGLEASPTVSLPATGSNMHRIWTRFEMSKLTSPPSDVPMVSTASTPLYHPLQEWQNVRHVWC